MYYAAQHGLRRGMCFDFPDVRAFGNAVLRFSPLSHISLLVDMRQDAAACAGMESGCRLKGGWLDIVAAAVLCAACFVCSRVVVIYPVFRYAVGRGGLCRMWLGCRLKGGLLDLLQMSVLSILSCSAPTFCNARAASAKHCATRRPSATRCPTNRRCLRSDGMAKAARSRVRTIIFGTARRADRKPPARHHRHRAVFRRNRRPARRGRCSKNGIAALLCNHEFHRTPPQEEIVCRLKQMEDCVADICKIAVMPHSAEDVLTLLSATLEAKRLAAKPIVTMSMGQTGAVSCLAGEVFGCCITFGSGTQDSAPGKSAYPPSVRH